MMWVRKHLTKLVKCGTIKSNGWMNYLLEQIN